MQLPPPLVGPAEGSHLDPEGFNMNLAFFDRNFGAMLLGLCKGILALRGIPSGSGLFAFGVQLRMKLPLLTDDLEWNELVQLHP